MSTPKYFFLLVYFLFHAIFILGSIFVLEDNFGTNISWITRNGVIYFSLFGLLLFIVNVVLINWQISSANRKLKKQNTEINTLKARIYDSGSGISYTEQGRSAESTIKPRKDPEQDN